MHAAYVASVCLCRLERDRGLLQLECEDLLGNLDSLERSKVTREVLGRGTGDGRRERKGWGEERG